MISELCRHSAGGGVRLFEIAHLFKVSHLASHRRRREIDAGVVRQIFGTDRLARGYMRLNNGTKYLLFSFGKLFVSVLQFTHYLSPLLFSTLCCQVPNFDYNIILFCLFVNSFCIFFYEFFVNIITQRHRLPKFNIFQILLTNLFLYIKI